ncbi:unnamed protein product [Caenorhabditis auriculariae]|uniref:RING-type domain-containing protein n=1 Tax=Caenorhabditis auriculariae TaxID=2777116 RepID=A0A8S1HEC6_9PELO|nr:unnamed protein product [Caenorhabditis auriculariae]
MLVQNFDKTEGHHVSGNFSHAQSDSSNLIKSSIERPAADYLPGFVAANRKDIIENISLYHNLSKETGPEYIYTITWTSSSRDAEKRWRKRSVEKKTVDALEVRTPPPAVVCDGPCNSVVPLTNIIQFGNCDHNVCTACLTSHKSVPNFDGSPGCCNEACVKLARDLGESLHGGITSSSSMSAISTRAPCETIVIYVSLLEKMRHNTVRTQFEFELSSSDRVSILPKLLSKHERVLTDAAVYYSSSRPKTKSDMMQLSLNSRLRFLDLVDDNTSLFIVIAGKGVRV